MDPVIMIYIFFFIVISLSAVIHEYAHGWMADRLGDPTAKLSGRLTLNPLAHIDPIGTFLLPAAMFLFTGGRFLFAYAKPVPVNLFNLRNLRFGSAAVAIAGPASNIILAVVFGVIIRLFPGGLFSEFLSIVVYANLLLAIFNLVPLPPLDGSKILFAVLPSQFNDIKVFLEAYGWTLLLLFAFFFFYLIVPIIDFAFKLLTGMPGINS